LLIAGMDQAKFYYGAQASDAASLRRAEQLNPYDAGLQLRLARANEQQGNHSGNQSALEAAVRINPSYRAAQVALARQLIESGKYAAAYAHYEQMFIHLRPDVDSLINFGLLASQLNHQDEAINAWQRALVLDSSQANAHLYLADALARKKQFKDSIPHYEQYLGLVATQTSVADPPGAVPHPAAIVKVVLQLASACENAGDDEAASHFITQATRLAEKAGDKSGLILALVQSADINAKHDRTVEALAEFQRALTLENASTSAGQPEHWFKYGRFLQRTRLYPRLVFACFVKADVLFRGDDNLKDHDLAELVSKELSVTAAALDAATIRSIKLNLTPVLQEALILKL
jgi:tetratricopeptide (TPR) repeat protein